MAGRCKGKAVFMNITQPCEHDAYDDEGYCTVHALLNARAENQRLRMNLDAYKQAEELWCRQDEKREAENQRLREALQRISMMNDHNFSHGDLMNEAKAALQESE